MIDVLIKSIFFGFGVFILLSGFVAHGKLKNTIEDLTDVAIDIIRLAGIAFLISWLLDWYSVYRQSGDEYYALINRMSGPYWFGYWLYPLTYGATTQLFWFRKLKKSKAIRILSALLILFILYLEKLIIVITSLHRDYIPSGWILLQNPFIISDWLIQMGIFAGILAIAYVIKAKRKLHRNNAS